MTLPKAEWLFPPICQAPTLRIASTSFANVGPCLKRLRGWVRAYLIGTAHEAVLASVLIAVNELSTNALCHTRSGRRHGSFTVTLAWDEKTVRVVVGDQGGDTLPDLQVADLDAESGRGLRVTASLADRFGWSETAFGCEVWAEFDGPEESAKLAQDSEAETSRAAGGEE